jgi:hypothetical protein
MRLVGHVFLTLVVAVAAISPGCGSSNTVVITQSRTTEPGPFKRLAVFVSLPAGGGDRGIFHGLKKVMPGELAACAVESSIVAGTPDEGDPKAPSHAADAQLIVRARSGQLSSVTTVDQFGNVLDEKAFKELELDFWFELLDFKLRRVTWLAFANLHMTDSGNVAGEDLARAIVARLRADGVLKGCR